MITMGLILKICGSEWRNASRDKRELSMYRELGYDVLVMAKGEPGDRGRPDEVDGFPVLRYSTRPLGGRVPNLVNRFVSLFQWAHAARALHPDVISGHDLLPGLTIAWMSTWFQSKKPKLIYDSHEFELGRNACRGSAQKALICRWERFLMKRCAFSIMVNDTIADEVQRIHKLKDRPIVVRSTPDNWTLEPDVIAQTRRVLTPDAEAFLVLYHGALTTGRGIETLLRMTAKNDYVCAVILGNGGAAYVQSLRVLAEELGVADRVVFHPAVPISELWKFVGAADLSLMMIEGKAKSYYYALPNKFFESIQSLTPVAASDFPEMKRLIDEYEIGLTCDPTDLDAVCACVEKMRTDTAFYAACKDNLKTAKADLCWEKEKHVLADAFARYVKTP